MRAKHYIADVNEHAIQSLVVEYLEAMGYVGQFFAIPNAAKRSPWLYGRLKKEGLLPGVADLCFMLPGGKVAWLEMKTAKGRQTDDQKNFQLVCMALDHPYAIARSLDEALAILKSWKVIK